MEEDAAGVFNDTIGSVDAKSSAESEGFFSVPLEQSLAVNSSGTGDDLGADFGNFASSTQIVKAIDQAAANSPAVHSCELDQGDLAPGTTNIMYTTDLMVLTKSNAEFDPADPLSTTAVDPESQVNNDEFDDFTSTADALAPSSDSPIHVDSDEASLITDLAATQGDDDDLAIFDSSEPVETASFVENRNVSDASGGEVAVEPVPILSASETQAENDVLISSSTVVELQRYDFGEFGTADPLAPTATVESQVGDGDDEFGDFGAAEPIHTTSNLESLIDDDDFGDFDGTATAQSGTENVDPQVDDDDFGDFDEAPIAESKELTENTFEFAKDPVLDRLYASFPKLFAPTSNEESSSDFDAGSDLPVPLFTESGFVSIESCLVCCITCRFLFARKLLIFTAFR
jgi:hypothetical protein